MSGESFYGVTLTGESNTVQWEVLSNEEDFPSGQKLFVRQIPLGAAAKENEFNIVEVHTVKNNLRISLAVFYEISATFKLIKGNGPVYIKDEVEVADMQDDETDEEDEDEAQPTKKPKL